MLGQPILFSGIFNNLKAMDMSQENILKSNILADKPYIAVIELNKNILGGAEALEFSNLLDKLTRKNVLYIIIDLKAVELMNSSGLGMLVSGLSRMRQHNITLCLAELPEKVKVLLKMTHLDEVFTVFETFEDAVNELNA